MSDESNVVVRRRKLSDYSQDYRNANAGSQRGGHLIAESLQKTGAHRSLVADKNGVLVAGNKTSEGAAEVGIEDVIEIETDGKALVVVKRTDFDLNDPDPNNIARKAAYFDNQAALQSITWDAEQIMADHDGGLDMSEWFRPEELNGLLASVVVGNPVLDERSTGNNMALIRRTNRSHVGLNWGDIMVGIERELYERVAAFVDANEETMGSRKAAICHILEKGLENA